MYDLSGSLNKAILVYYISSVTLKPQLLEMILEPEAGSIPLIFEVPSMRVSPVFSATPTGDVLTEGLDSLFWISEPAIKWIGEAIQSVGACLYESHQNHQELGSTLLSTLALALLSVLILTKLIC